MFFRKLFPDRKRLLRHVVSEQRLREQMIPGAPGGPRCCVVCGSRIVKGQRPMLIFVDSKAYLYDLAIIV